MIRLELRVDRDGSITTSLECEDWHPAAEVEPWIRAWAAANSGTLDTMEDRDDEPADIVQHSVAEVEEIPQPHA